MAKKIYAGVEGNARKVKKIYLGVGNTARKVKKIYIGVNGTARQCWASAFDFTYTGNYKFSGNPDGDWAISFLSTGTLTVHSAPTPVDIFCCGGGENGGNGSDWNGYGGTHYDGGSGGRGGKCNMAKGLKIAEGGNYYIGVGGEGENSVAFDVSAEQGSYGGAAGGTHGEFNGTSGQSGEYAFGEADFAVPYFGSGFRFGAGGGGGASGIRWDDGREPAGSAGSGGASGGGRGADYYSGGSYAQSGRENSGGGGGGGCGPYHTSGASGGSGVVIIRNAR